MGDEENPGKTRTCSSCGSLDIENDPINGLVCTDCGCLLSAGNIVNTVGFNENPSGKTSVQGQFIGDTFPPIEGRPTFFGGYRDNRENTLRNGKKKMAQVAAALSLPPPVVEQAHRFFKLAVEHNFIQGRRTQNVVAACLYIICRRAKSPHMLIDFADVLSTNVYTLGRTFLKFKKLLNLSHLLVIDPSIYIHRFASKLDFGAKRHKVAESAVRLVSRMKRDWMLTGRRPAGLCGAALLIAARMHGFKRTQKEVTRVVHVCSLTLRKRLGEFEKTASSALTLEEFETVDLEEEADPPSFAAGLLVEAAKKELPASDQAEVEKIAKHIDEDLEDEDDDEAERPTKRAKREGNGTDGKKAKKSKTKGKGKSKKKQKRKKRKIKGEESDVSDVDEHSDESDEDDRGEKMDVDVERPPAITTTTTSTTTTTTAAIATATADAAVPLALVPAVVTVTLVSLPPSAEARDDGDHPMASGGSEAMDVSIDRLAASMKGDTATKDSEDSDNLSNLDDAEIEGFLLTEDEVKIKTEIWEELNEEYMILVAEKAAAKAAAAAEAAEKPKKRAPKRKKGVAATAEEAVKETFSSHINYASDLFQNLFPGQTGEGLPKPS